MQKTSVLESWKESLRMNPYKLCLMGVLVALQIVLARITAIPVGSWLRIGFGFLPVGIAGYLLGPVWGMAVAAIGDILGTLVFTPAIIWGLVLANALNGLIFGLFLYPRKLAWWRCIVSLVLISIFCNFLLNTHFLGQAGWVALSDGSEWPAFFRTLVMPLYPEGTMVPNWVSVCNRFIKQLVACPVNIVMLYLVLQVVEKMPKSVLRLK